MKFLSEGPAQWLGAAALPVPAKLAQAYQSHAAVVGNPGLAAIPAPRPAGVPQGITHRTAGAPLYGSSDAPAAWFPAYYYYGRDSMNAPPVAWISDNQLPMPAIDPQGLPAAMQVAPTFLRQRQVTQPNVTPKFENYNRVPRQKKRRRGDR